MTLLQTLLDQSWFFSPDLGWVVMDRNDYRNAPDSEQRCLIRCDDWTEHSFPRTELARLVLWSKHLQSFKHSAEQLKSIALLKSLQEEFAKRRARFEAARLEQQRLWEHEQERKQWEAAIALAD